MTGLHDSHLYIAAITAYFMGLIACLTPCVYPLIPITLSLFGARNESSRVKAFALSFSYVSGMALTYTILGVVTVKLGMVFGTLLGSPYVVIPMCAILFLLALHSLGVLSLPFGALQSKANSVGGAGFIGAFLMGAVSGGVAAPCVGPVLAILLVEVAQSHDMTRSVSMLLAYSFGLGTPFIILGTFSSLLSSLPRSGNWLHYVKFLIAASIFGLIFFLLNSLTTDGLLPSDPKYIWIAILALSIPLGIFTVQRSLYKKQIICSALLALSAVQIGVPSHASLGTESFQWINDQNAGMENAKAQGKPMMIDLSARWCVACKELEHTFSQNDVAREIKSKLVPVKIDFTAETPTTQEISAKYGVVGLPCVLFVKPDGQEVANSRITGKVSPEEFLAHMKQLEGRL